MSAFEKAWPTFCLPGEYDDMDACDQGRWKGVAQQAWNAALEHAAKVCDEYQRERNKFTVKDGQEGIPTSRRTVQQ